MDVLDKPVVEFVALLEHFEDFERSSDDAWSEGVTEQVGARTLAQQVDDFLPACGEAAKGSAEGFS